MASVTISGEIYRIEDTVLVRTNGSYVAIDIEENKNLRTGTYIEANVTRTTNRPKVLDYNIVTASPLDETHISSITFIVDICSRKNTYNVSYVQSKWFPGLQDQFARCSNRMKLFEPAHNIIMDVIKVPCTLTINNSCNVTDLYELLDFVDNYVSDQYDRRIIIMPYLSHCPWVGIANIGCGTRCGVWINGKFITSAVFHEVGHTFGLMHSGKDMPFPDEYGDHSCAMGQPESNSACYNAAHNDILGWTEPEIRVDSADQLPRTVSIKSTTFNRVNGIKVYQYWNTTIQEYIYISFLDGYFQSSTFKNVVLIHKSSNVGVPESRYTNILAVMKIGSSTSVGNLIVTFKDIINNTAVLQLCDTSCVYPKPQVCGDGICSEGRENKTSCARDCCPKAVCGNKICEAWSGEDCTTCPSDCNRVGNVCCGQTGTCGMKGCKMRKRRCTMKC